jgi:hypothetical protein
MMISNLLQSFKIVFCEKSFKRKSDGKNLYLCEKFSAFCVHFLAICQRILSQH